MRLHAIPFSTNVERVRIALAHKGLHAELVMHDPADRRALAALSGQELTPVLELDDGQVLNDSPAILRALEYLHPSPPLWPIDPATRAEADVFIDWFNGVWKIAPNAIADELAGPAPDLGRLATHRATLAADLDRFVALLDGRDHLLGDEFGIADVTAWPFLRYALDEPGEDDHDVFHRVLHDDQPLAERHAPLVAWIERVRPRVPPQ
jgi:glutathione S-transferase